MKKPLATRILGLTVTYCVIFLILVVLQFSSSGNFSLPAGAMVIRGRYLQSPKTSANAPEAAETREQDVSGGIRVFYGGLEFSLKENDKNGLVLSGADNVETSVNPIFMIREENTARFGLPGGTVITFISLDSARGPELRISAEFADNVSAAVIPIAARRASLVRDNEHLGIIYNGSRYLFSGYGQELENGKLILSKQNASLSYYSRGKQKIFDPADYIIPQAQDYNAFIANWQNSSYTYWNQNASLLQNEDDIIAYSGEALRRGTFANALRSIPSGFYNSSQTYKSSGFTGNMTSAYASFTAAENQKTNRISTLIRERSPDVFREEHLLDYLFARNNITLANDVINFIQSVPPEKLLADHGPGLLEIYSDLKRWQPQANNPAEALNILIEQVLTLVSDTLNRDTEKNLVYASHAGGMDLEYSLRLGKALVFWADDSANSEWAAIGRSLVISALTSGGAGSGNLYCILNPQDYYPRAALLTNTGYWAWTVSPSARAVIAADTNMSISFSFPVNTAHYAIIRGVRPFIRIQFHGRDWRTDTQFEQYDSSGWVYYPQDQILILKLRHMTTVETIRLIYREEPPPPPVEEETGVEDGAEASEGTYLGL